MYEKLFFFVFTPVSTTLHPPFVSILPSRRIIDIAFPYIVYLYKADDCTRIALSLCLSSEVFHLECMYVYEPIKGPFMYLENLTVPCLCNNEHYDSFALLYTTFKIKLWMKQLMKCSLKVCIVAKAKLERYNCLERKGVQKRQAHVKLYNEACLDRVMGDSITYWLYICTLQNLVTRLKFTPPPPFSHV